MINFINENEKRLEHRFNKIIEYIEFLSDFGRGGQFYHDYKSIIYPSIINSIYVSFENDIKQLFLSYYKVLKQQTDFSSTFNVKFLSWNSIPGYILEEFTLLDIESNSLKLDLTDEVMSFTSKNMNLEEIQQLFARIGINSAKIGTSISNGIKLMDEYSEVLSWVEPDKRSSPKELLKAFIRMRNATSHSLLQVDEYEDIRNFKEIMQFLKEIYSILFLITVEEAKNSIYKLDEFKAVNYFKSCTIIAMDNTEGLDLTCESKILNFGKNGLEILDIVSLKSENQPIKSTAGYHKIGIEVSKAVNRNLNPKKNNFYII